MDEAMHKHLSGTTVNHSFDISYQEFHREQEEFHANMQYVPQEAVNMRSANALADPFPYSYDHGYGPGFAPNFEYQEPSGFSEDF